MENATKALLIAGGVLLFVLLATFAMFMFRSMSQSVSRYYDAMDEQEVREINQQFLNYEYYKDDERKRKNFNSSRCCINYKFSKKLIIETLEFL